MPPMFTWGVHVRFHVRFSMGAALCGVLISAISYCHVKGGVGGLCGLQFIRVALFCLRVCVCPVGGHVVETVGTGQDMTTGHFLILFKTDTGGGSPQGTIPLSKSLPYVVPPIPLRLLPFPHFLQECSISQLSS